MTSLSYVDPKTGVTLTGLLAYKVNKGCRRQRTCGTRRRDHRVIPEAES
jgi:hypothetical protein